MTAASTPLSSATSDSQYQLTEKPPSNFISIEYFKTMKNILNTALCALLTLLLAAVSAQSAEHDGVKATVQDFLQAYVTGDGDFMRKAFRKDGMMIGHSRRGDKVMVVSGDEFAGRFDGKPADDEALRKRGFQILDISESAALVKVALDYPNWDGVDYLALAKIDGKWLIVSKSYSGLGKPAPQRDATAAAASAGAR
jgi:hypothetical protein